MLQLKEQTVMVWDAKPSEKMNNTVEATLSTSKKVTKDGNDSREYMSWKARFVGQAFEKAKELKDKDIVKILSGTVENFYNKEKEKSYVTVIIFDFEKKE